MKRIAFISVIFLFSSNSILRAQCDPQVSNYWAVPHYYNPGCIGQSGKLELIGLYRMQWIGITHAPITSIISAEMPLNFLEREHIIGVLIYNDKIGLFNITATFGRYIYKCNLREGNLNIGIQIGYINELFEGTKGEIPNNNDYIPSSNITGKSIDGSFGINYNTNNWHIGFSTTHLTSPKLKLSDNSTNSEIPRTYYFTTEYNVQLNNPLLELQPSMLLKAIEKSFYYTASAKEEAKQNLFKSLLTQTQLDISLRMIYNKMFWGGLSWRKNESIIFMLGGKFKTWEAGYAYDVPVFSNLIKVTSGSQELFIKHITDLNLKKRIKIKHKSVRIL